MLEQIIERHLAVYFLQKLSIFDGSVSETVMLESKIEASDPASPKAPTPFLRTCRKLGVCKWTSERQRTLCLKRCLAH